MIDSATGPATPPNAEAEPDADAGAFDRALLRAAFDEIEWQGWHGFTTASAARSAGLSLEAARSRFPVRASVALRLGELADRAALASIAAAPDAAPRRETLFDAMMQRFDVLQSYRGGVLAMLRAARFDPALAARLAIATPFSIGWIADAAGIETGSWRGIWTRQVLTAAWTYAAHAWTRDESTDLTATMAALDRGLDRAARVVDLGVPHTDLVAMADENPDAVLPASQPASGKA